MPNGDLKKADELKNDKFVVFAVPNTFYPVDREWYVRAHPYGIARVAADAKLKFASDSLN